MANTAPRATLAPVALAPTSQPQGGWAPPPATGAPPPAPTALVVAPVLPQAVDPHDDQRPEAPEDANVEVNVVDVPPVVPAVVTQPTAAAVAAAEPPPATGDGVETTTTPTVRDRAFTYVMQLSVTRVRDMCRDAGLKQFGKKAESQPRLFWGADTTIEGSEDAGDDGLEAWCQALTGLREWLQGPHRDQTTLWRAAPPRSARPYDFHTYFALPTRNDSRSAAQAQQLGGDGDECVSFGAGEVPNERDRLYTFARSLSITVVRRTCKQLSLKQFGRKRESQVRLFWHITSTDYQMVASADGTPLCDPRGDGLRWAATATPEVWYRAPSEELRPVEVARYRHQGVPRRRKFAAFELARVVGALISTPEMRARSAMVFASRPGAAAGESSDLGAGAAGEEGTFWLTMVAPVFNDTSFSPRMPPCVREQPTTVEPRGGDELRRHFDRACPAFIRAYTRWRDDGAQPGRFDAYLRERRRSDNGAPLSPTEKRAAVVFAALKCGEHDEATDVLNAILDFPVDIKAESLVDEHAVLAPPPSTPLDHMHADPPDLAHQPDADGDGELQVQAHAEPQVNVQMEEVTYSAGAAAGGGAAAAAGGTEVMVEVGNTVLGKRPDAPSTTDVGALHEEVSALRDEVRAIKRRLDKIEPNVRLRNVTECAQREKVLSEAIIAARQVKKDLDADADNAEENQRLRAANANAIERLTRELEAHNNQEEL